MIKLKTLAFALATLATLTGPALAQNGQRREQQVDGRQENQQDRIGAGVTSGQLTAGETARLERNQASINRETARMQRSGHFTRRDQRIINRRENNQSRAIYNLRHNGRHQ